MRPKKRRTPKAKAPGMFTIYEKELMRNLHLSKRPKTTNKLASDLSISWKTTDNYLKSLYKKGIVQRKKSRKKTLWKPNF